MKIQLEPTRVDHIEFTLNVTMPLGEWREVLKSLRYGKDGSYHNKIHEFRDGIWAAIEMAEKNFKVDTNVNTNVDSQANR